MEHTCFDEQQVVCRLHRRNIKRKKLAEKILMNLAIHQSLPPNFYAIW